MAPSHRRERHLSAPMQLNLSGPPRTGWQTIRSLAPFLWPKDNWRFRLRLVISALFLVAAKVATVYVPIVYARAIDALSPKQGAAFVPVALIVAYGLLRVASAGFGELRDAVFAAVKQRAIRTMAVQTFEHMHRLSLRFHLDRQTGGLSRAIERGVEGAESVLRLGVFNVLPTLLELLLVTGLVWRMFDWRFAAVTLGAVFTYVLFTMGFASWRVRFRRQMNAMDNEANNHALDSLLNYETVKYFGNEPHESRRFDRAQASYEIAAVRAQVTLNMLNLGQAAIISAGLVAVMLMAARGVDAHSMSLGRFVLVNTYLMQLYQPLNFLGFVYNNIKQGITDMEQMFGLLRVEQEVADRPGAIQLPPHLDNAPAGTVTFDHVGFAYRPERQILRDVSFTIPAGKRLAIVGPTGAGKSTISRLLFRFYDATSGAVRVDGHDIRDIQQKNLRASIGVVPQDTVLFNDTIGYNIAYGRPGATQNEIEEAARVAQIHDFIARQPEGYKTVVGERGLKLSGGEKQRVAIARTVLKNPRILILDEATSALDTRTEQDIQSALRAVSAHRTSLVIAHRLSTVVDADEIIVLSDGMVAERGDHAQLLALGGVYARMWALQAEQQDSPV